MAGEDTEATTDGTATDRSTESATIQEVVQREQTQRYIRFTVGAFLAVGFGYALSFLLLDAFAGSETTLGTFGGATAGLGAGFITAPLVAVITGIPTGIQLGGDDYDAATAAAIGSFIGFVVMVVVLFVFVASTAPDGAGGGGGSLGDLLGPMIGYGLGVAFTGAAAAWTTDRYY
ncbi:MAG: hypothetical protein ABEJ57_03205 [Halobacteriaceae archaeon]